MGKAYTPLAMAPEGIASVTLHCIGANCAITTGPVKVVPDNGEVAILATGILFTLSEAPLSVALVK
jgi:hypothetical protein